MTGLDYPGRPGAYDWGARAEQARRNANAAHDATPDTIARADALAALEGADDLASQRLDEITQLRRALATALDEIRADIRHHEKQRDHLLPVARDWPISGQLSRIQAAATHDAKARALAGAVEIIEAAVGAEVPDETAATS